MIARRDDAYDPQVTLEDLGRPTRAEAERDMAERDTTPQDGPLAAWLAARWAREWDGRGEE